MLRQTPVKPADVEDLGSIITPPSKEYAATSQVNTRETIFQPDLLIVTVSIVVIAYYSGSRGRIFEPHRASANTFTLLNTHTAVTPARRDE